MTRFTEFFIRENGLPPFGFGGWVFYPGMLFRATEKWWGDRMKRNNPHEGIDFCFYKNELGRIVRLGKGTKVPVMYDGVAVTIIDDFLGKSVVIEHRPPGSDMVLLTIYGHIIPTDSLGPGLSVKAGDVIGTLAIPDKARFDVLPHLHVSFALVVEPILYKDLDWKRVNTSKALTILGPLDIVDGQYTVLRPDIPTS
jgi:hypothetical protein